LKEKIDSVKTKKNTKRLLSYDENDKIHPPSKLFTAIDQIWENNRIDEELREELVSMHKQEVSLEIEPVSFAQNVLFMGSSYDPYMYSSWEKELDPDNFKERLLNLPFCQGTVPVKEEEEQHEEYIEVYHRSRTLSSMFE
jgi:hypothetical protein